jgi:hypothetical protein
MRSEDDIRQKYKQLLGRNLEKALQRKLGRKPHNCVHNHVQSTLVNKENKIEVEHTGLCMLNKENPALWEGRICETSADARFCPYFTQKHSKQVVYEEFMDRVRDPEVLQHEYRDLYTLHWVLGDEVPDSKLSLVDRIKFWLSNHNLANLRFGLVKAESPEEIDSLAKKLFHENED